MSQGNGKHLSALDYALSHWRAGQCPLPVKADGSKAPAVRTWPDKDGAGKPRLPTEAELRQRFGGRSPVGVAVACGAVSGNLNVIDSEYADFTGDLAELVEAGRPGLMAELPHVRTPGKQADNPGDHFFFRSPAPISGGKLALLTEDEARLRTGDPKKKTAIELKADGGYVLVPGCPPSCHESGRTYRHVGGPPIEEAPVLAQEDVDLLLRCARMLTQVPDGDAYHGQPDDGEAADGDGLRPGDDFNRRATWEQVLEPHGWAVAQKAGRSTRWRRPGKDRGWSATTGHCTGKDGTDLLAVFTSNGEPFPGPTGAKLCSCHSKFDAYARLNHGGDYKAAAKELARQGYGDQKKARATFGEAAGPGDGDIVLGDLTLRPGAPRQTPSGKLTVPVRVYRGDRPIDQLVVTSSGNGRQEAARALLTRGKGVTADRAAEAVAAVIAWGLARLEESRSGARQGDTLREILDRLVRKAFDPTHRVGRRVWLNGLGQDFDRPSFLHLLNEEMLDACRGASDVGEGEDRYALMGKAEAELRVLFGDLMTSLPDGRPEDAPIHAGERTDLAEAVIAMWTVPKCLTKVKADGEERTYNTSLANLAKDLIQNGKVEGDTWHQLHPAHNAFIARVETVAADGEARVEVLLGMNHELSRSTGVRLPEKVNHLNLRKLGKKAGIFREVETANSHTSTGGDRVIVLGAKQTAYLLEDVRRQRVGQGNCQTAGGGGLNCQTPEGAGAATADSFGGA